MAVRAIDRGRGAFCLHLPLSPPGSYLFLRCRFLASRLPVTVGAEGGRGVTVSRAVVEDVGEGYPVRLTDSIAGEAKGDFGYPRLHTSHTAVSSVMVQGSRDALLGNPEHTARGGVESGRNGHCLRWGGREGERGGGACICFCQYTSEHSAHVLPGSSIILHTVDASRDFSFFLFLQTSSVGGGGGYAAILFILFPFPCSCPSRLVGNLHTC